MSPQCDSVAHRPATESPAPTAQPLPIPFPVIPGQPLSQLPPAPGQHALHQPDSQAMPPGGTHIAGESSGRKKEENVGAKSSQG